MNRRAAIVVAVLALLGALFAYSEHLARKRAELQLGIDSSRIVAQVFAPQNALKVLEISGKVTARALDNGVIFDNQQSVSAPYTVDYFVDLSRVEQGRYRWDAQNRRLMIEVPDPWPARPNIDESRAEVRQSGIFISRQSGRRMAERSTQLMDGAAAADARKPENLAKARDAAREALRQNALAPLRAAGVDIADVVIRFESQGRQNSDQWDLTTPIEDVAAKLESMR